MAEKPLTPVQEDYLALIFEEQSAKGTASGCSIVQQTGVTRGTVAATLRPHYAHGARVKARTTHLCPAPHH